MQINRQPHREHRQRQLEKPVLTALKSIAQVTHINLTTLAGELHRVVRYRLDEYPQGSGINWVENKGMVGRACRDRSPRHFDWRQVAAAWSDPGLDPDCRLRGAAD